VGGPTGVPLPSSPTSSRPVGRTPVPGPGPRTRRPPRAVGSSIPADAASSGRPDSSGTYSRIEPRSAQGRPRWSGRPGGRPTVPGHIAVRILPVAADGVRVRPLTSASATRSGHGRAQITTGIAADLHALRATNHTGGRRGTDGPPTHGSGPGLSSGGPDVGATPARIRRRSGPAIGGTSRC
jgi:hypothetical protein